MNSEHALYAAGGLITVLTTSVVVLAGAWVKSHDSHRQWTVAKISEHSEVLALMRQTHQETREDIGEIKAALSAHMVDEAKMQRVMARKFDLHALMEKEGM